jgi:hypothetical protein
VANELYLVKQQVGNKPAGDSAEEHQALLDRELLPVLQELRTKFNRLIEGIESGDIANGSGVDGSTVSEALDTLEAAIAALTSDDIRDLSGVFGPSGTVTDALNALANAVSSILIDDGNWIPGGTDLKVSNGGTGASSAAGARTNLGLDYASAAEMETGTATDRVVAPGTQHRHPSAVKCWGWVNVSSGTPGIVLAYNVTSITDVANDKLGVTIANDFSANGYIVLPGAGENTDGQYLLVWENLNARSAGAFELCCAGGDVNVGTTGIVEPKYWYWGCLGDQ